MRNHWTWYSTNKLTTKAEATTNFGNKHAAQKKKTKRKKKFEQSQGIKKEAASVTWNLRESSYEQMPHEVNYVPVDGNDNEEKRA